jgi:hypothetical protein
MGGIIHRMPAIIKDNSMLNSTTRKKGKCDLGSLKDLGKNTGAGCTLGFLEEMPNVLFHGMFTDL